MNPVKIGLFLLLSFLSLVLGMLSYSTSVRAAESRPVLLVYDSKNIVDHADLDLDRCQRLLTSLGLTVKTLQVTDYHHHELLRGHFQGVITMTNWTKQRFQNRMFERDRATYKGTKLHIGPAVQPDEQAALKSQFKTLVHQQMILHQGRSTQMLKIHQQLTVVSKPAANAIPVGWLSDQVKSKRTYTYGLIHQRAGYLPNLSEDGVPVTIASRLIAELFHRPLHQHKPMLTITGVTPYSDLTRLRALIHQLSDHGYAFALSITSVSENTNLAAYGRFTRVLRTAEQNGGLIFLSPSAEMGTHLLTGDELRSVFQTELAGLGMHHVYPVGISASGYWNQSQRRQLAVLDNASHVLLLPNQPEVLANQPLEKSPKVTVSRQYKTAIYGIPYEGFETISHLETLQFVSPTALLIKMPRSMTGVKSLLNRLEHTQLQWFDPIKDQFNSSLEAGLALYGYRSGQYWVNGEPLADLNFEAPQKLADSALPTAADSWMNRVIQWQSNVLVWVFSAIGLLLSSLLVVGWRVYRRKFTK